MKLFAKGIGLFVLGCTLRLAYEGAFPGAPGPESLFAATAQPASAPPAAPTEYAADFVGPTAELAVSLDQLPNDAHAWHLSVFTHTRLSAQDRQVLDWFASEPNCVKLKSQTLWHHLQPAASVWPRYKNLTSSGLPAIVLQDATGKVIYKASGDDVPKTPWPLLKGIADCIRAHCPHCPRPRPRPAPEPDEPDEPDLPDVPDVVKPLPDVIGPNDNTPPGAKDDTLVAAIAVFGVALAASFIFAARGNKVI